MEPGPSSLSFRVTWQGSPWLPLSWDCSRCSSVFGGVTMPAAPGDGQSPAHGFGSAADVADRRDGLFPLEGGHAAGCNLNKPWGCSKLTAILGDKESKKSWFEAMCSSAVPLFPQRARHMLPKPQAKLLHRKQFG